MRGIFLVLIALMSIAFLSDGVAAPGLSQASSSQTRAVKKAKKAVVAPVPVDWAERASSELSAQQASTPTTQDAQLPTPATVRAEVQPVRPAIERTGLRLGVMLESYRPSGVGQVNTGEIIDYSQLPTSPLVQADLRWLPFERDRIVAGGYAAFGFARQMLPLVAASGFRYDDVTLNAIRTEVGGAVGYALAKALNLESRLGLGRLSHIQTSRYPEFNGSYDRPYGILAVDLSYHFIPQVAVLVSAANRTPLSDGSGGLSFEPLVISGGLLVQLR
ncbi:MAG: hypothetical protein IPJ84_10650 [Bdellovibrionales bacterium]|nr:hypothetical protein [Bdellovibrionales bacterium]